MIEAVIHVAPETSADNPGARRWVLIATIVASTMAFVDLTLVNVALPAVQADLHATAAQVQWVIEIYTLFLSSLLLLGGSLGDRYGRRTVFGIGVAVFGFASLWCALSAGAVELITARAVQGIGAALLVPGSLALISAFYPPDQRGAAIGTWAAWSSIASGVGPAIGGWLIEHWSWRAAFVVNIPLALAVVLILFTRVPERQTGESGAALDLWGTLAGTLGFGGIIYGLIESDDRGFADPVVLASLLVGALALAAFIPIERRARSPMVPLRLFRSPTFSGANLLTLFLYGALGGALFFLPFILIRLDGYSAAGAGASFLPFSLILFALSRWAGGLVGRVGARLPLIVGPLLVAAGFLLFAVPGRGTAYWTAYFPPMALLGIGMGIAVAPLTTAVMGAVEEQYVGAAAGINNAVARTAGLITIAVFGIVVVHVLRSGVEAHFPMLGISPRTRAYILQHIQLGGMQFTPDVPPHARTILRRASNAAMLDGYRLVMLVSACLAAGSALTAALLVDRSTSTREETPGR